MSHETGRETARGPVLQITKLHRPVLRDGTVRRARLTRTLVAARPSLTLVVAPPGFGKTSLLADWADIDPRPFAWVAIDRQDNDPTVLWTYIGAALGLATEGEEAADRLGALAREPDPATAIFAQLKTPAAGVVLVLDDYHLIEADECHETVMRMVELAPPGMELAISSRTDPPLPIARLRATERLAEFRAPDLQFTPEETAVLVNTSLDLGLGADSVSTLHERTDGWPAGLYLAYLSMRAIDALVTSTDEALRRRIAAARSFRFISAGSLIGSRPAVGRRRSSRARSRAGSRYSRPHSAPPSA